MSWSKVACGLTVLCVIAVLVGAGKPAWASPPAQLQVFRKSSWGLTMQHPTAWTLQQDTDDLVAFAFSSPPDYAVFIMTQSDLYTDPNYAMADTFWDIINKIEADVEMISLEPGESRTVAGTTARTATFVATDWSNGVEVTGELLVFAKANKGFAVLAGSPTDTWQLLHAPAVETMVKSIRLSEPTPTPRPTRRITPTPTRRAARTPTPTRRPTQTPTPTASPTVEEGREMTARGAYELAQPVAQEWDPESQLSEATCYDPTWGDDHVGRCAEWSLTFFGKKNESPQKQLTIYVTYGRIDPSQNNEQDATSSRAIEGDWVDSPAALQSFMDSGGKEFLERHSTGYIHSMSLTQFEGDPNPVWKVLGVSLPILELSNQWVVYVEAPDGSVNTAIPKVIRPARKYLSAREAFDIALEAARKWKSDAQLLSLRASINPSEPGYKLGKAGEWSFKFYSRSENKTYTLYVTAGQVNSGAEAEYAGEQPVSGDWIDSPQALERFRASEDLIAFAKKYPEHEILYSLNGYKDFGHIWDIAAATKGIILWVTASVPQAATTTPIVAEATPTPEPTTPTKPTAVASPTATPLAESVPRRTPIAPAVSTPAKTATPTPTYTSPMVSTPTRTATPAPTYTSPMVSTPTRTATSVSTATATSTLTTTLTSVMVVPTRTITVALTLTATVAVTR